MLRKFPCVARGIGCPFPSVVLETTWSNSIVVSLLEIRFEIFLTNTTYFASLPKSLPSRLRFSFSSGTPLIQTSPFNRFKILSSELLLALLPWLRPATGALCRSRISSRKKSYSLSMITNFKGMLQANPWPSSLALQSLYSNPWPNSPSMTDSGTWLPCSLWLGCINLFAKVDILNVKVHLAWVWKILTSGRVKNISHWW